MIASILQIFGLGLIVLAVGFVSLIAACFLAGVACVLIGLALERTRAE